MEYGIRLNDGSWMQFLSEYHNNKKTLTFRTHEEAEIYAQNVELKNFVIEAYDDSKSTARK